MVAYYFSLKSEIKMFEYWRKTQTRFLEKFIYLVTKGYAEVGRKLILPYVGNTLYNSEKKFNVEMSRLRV